MTIPRGIQVKMLAAAKAAPAFEKKERSDAGFNFVGIDTFYRDVASLLHDLGLGFVTVEEGIEILPFQNQDGNYIVCQKFRFDVFDSETGEVAEGYSRLTITSPFSDAQTAGIGLSYADKAFLRSALKIVTGEKDADHMARKRSKPAAQPAARTDDEEDKPSVKRGRKPAEPKPEPESKDAAEDAEASEENWDAIADHLVTLLDALENMGQVEKFRVDQAGEINKLKKAAAESEDADTALARVQKKFGQVFDKFDPNKDEEE